MPKKHSYVIFGGVDKHDDQPLFWSNVHGWGTLGTCTRFTKKERDKTSHLPDYSPEYTPVWVEL